MDYLYALWTAAAVLPMIIITSLCIRCRKRIPVHIIETGYYEDKVPCTASSSFLIINRPQVPPRSSSSQPCMFPQDFLLTIPRSPVPAESRRSSVGREVKGYPNGCDSESISMGGLHCKIKDDDDDDGYDDEGEEANYSNDNLGCGYIEVLPDETDTNPGLVVASCSCIVDNRASLSSVATEDNYVNVGPSDSKVTVDGNYVNVGESSDLKGESLEYVNVDVVEKPPSFINQESDDDMPEYENVENDHKG